MMIKYIHTLERPQTDSIVPDDNIRKKFLSDEAWKIYWVREDLKILRCPKRQLLFCVKNLFKKPILCTRIKFFWKILIAKIQEYRKNETKIMNKYFYKLLLKKII